jgi:hypothetical protein
MAMTAYLQKAAGDHAIGKTAWTMPSDVSLGIFTASPGENGSLVSEFSGGAYTRMPLTAAMGACNAVTGIATNTSAITFPAPTATLGSTLYGAVIDESELGTGNVLFYAPWENPVVINNGSPAIVVPIGAITVQVRKTALALASDFIISSYLMKKLGDHAIGKTAFTMPAGVFHGLLASDPTVAGTLSSEVGVGGYARQPLTAAMNAFNATTGIASNGAEISYPTPTADYPTVNYSMVVDAVSAGNLLFARQLPSPMIIRNGASPALFPAGSINLTFA